MENHCEISSTSSTDSWMFVKNDKIGKDPVEKDELEDSDGISVISESEMLKNHTHSDDEKPLVEEVDEPSEECEEAIEEIELLTPPATPNDELVEEKSDEVTSKELELHQEFPTSTAREPNNHGAVLLIAMALVIAVLYTNISSLKKEFATTSSIYEQRIARLEEENLALKAQLNELLMLLRTKEEYVVPSLNAERVDETLQEERFIEKQEAANRRPITKDVWLGGEKEDVVKILDKKLNSLPDYCYFTDESDLFYEYNKENCERKKRKLDEKVKKFYQKKDQRAERVDDIYKSPRDKSYDEYMTQTTDQLLASLNDEIQEIKNARVTISITDNDNDKEVAADKMTKEKLLNDKKNSGKSDGATKRQQKKNFNENQEEPRKKRRKQRSEAEWNDRRTVGREEARNMKENEENWFLKRKNDREIHRLEKSV